MFVGLTCTNPNFINFYRSTNDKHFIIPSFPDSMHQVPCRFLSDLEVSRKGHAGSSLDASSMKVNRHGPNPKSKLGGVHQGSGCNGKVGESCASECSWMHKMGKQSQRANES